MGKVKGKSPYKPSKLLTYLQKHMNYLYLQFIYDCINFSHCLLIQYISPKVWILTLLFYQYYKVADLFELKIYNI